MKASFQFVFLIILLHLFACKKSTSKIEAISGKDQIKEIKKETISKKIPTIKKKVTIPKHYEYFFTTAKSGLNYRETPKGKVLGKFPLNTQLKVIEYTKILDQIQDGKKILKGEWLGVEKEMDTVYVFSELLSTNYVASDLKIYYLSSFYREENGENRTAFLNLSETYFSGVDDKFSLLKNNKLKDTIRLSSKQRRIFLKKTKISNQDKIFVYEIAKDSVHVFNVQETPLIACTNIYFDGSNYDKSELDYEFGFDLGKKYTGSDNNFVYVGKKNPFQTGKLKPIVWKKMKNKNFPVKFDTIILSKEMRWWFKDVEPKESYVYTNENFNYYIQNLAKNGVVDYRYMVVMDTDTNKIVFKNVFIDSEGTYLIALNFKNELPINETQWTGKMFKGKPTVVFGFLGNSFGCPSINFLDNTEPSIGILCDNRH